MPAPIAHFAVGTSPGLVVWLICLVGSRARPMRRWMLYVPLAMGLCGVAAMLPDLPQALAAFGIVERYLETKMAWQHSWWANLCFLHGWLDSLETHPDGSFARRFVDAGEVWGAIMFLAAFGMMTVGYLCELAKRNALPRGEVRESSSRPVASLLRN